MSHGCASESKKEVNKLVRVRVMQINQSGGSIEKGGKKSGQIIVYSHSHIFLELGDGSRLDSVWFYLLVLPFILGVIRNKLALFKSEHGTSSVLLFVGKLCLTVKLVFQQHPKTFSVHLKLTPCFQSYLS